MKCEICGDINGKQMIAKDFITKEKFTYSQCNNCGTLFLTDVPNSLEKYYSKEYYSFQVVENENLIQRFKNIRNNYDFFRTNFLGCILSSITSNSNLKALRSLQNLTKFSKLLDVGCGTGNDIKFLRKNGYENVSGIDPFIENDIYFNNKILVLKQDLFSVQGSYDFITLHHSFEHMLNPAKVLKKLFELLENDGTLMIRIPLADSFAFGKYRQNWVQLDAPRHTFLHTKKGMEILANDCGFKIIKTLYDSSSLQFWGSDLALENKSIHSIKKVEIIKSKILSFFKMYSLKAKELNKKQEGDQAIFLLKKSV